MVLGIDLGTTNSLIAVYRNEKTEIIPNRLGRFLTPSVVCVDEKNQILVGELAKEYSYLHPDRSAKVFKRKMGTSEEYTLGDYHFLPEELSSFVLRSLKEDGEVYLNEEVKDVIISVPAYFNDAQRKATVRAGELAGLNVLRIISEPTAAAVAYGVGSENINERCMVLDLGGGTFDVSILEYFHNIMEVHSIAGDNMLGGEDFTAAMIDLFLNKCAIDKSFLSIEEYAYLYKAAENAKCDFSNNTIIPVSLSLLGTPFLFEVTLDEYKEALGPLLERLKTPIEKSLRDSKLSITDIDRIILVGGATKLSIVREYIEKATGIKPDYYVDPDMSIALGAALQAAMKQRDKSIEEIILTDVCPFTLGTEVIQYNGSYDEPGHYLPIIQRNTVIPVSKTQRVYTAHDNQRGVTVKVLQGESRMAYNNFLLGQIEVEVPAGPKGQEAIDITYTYDVDSLLEVEVCVVSTKEKKKMVIQNSEHKLSDEEVQRRLDVLSVLKLNPREDEENQLILYKGNRLYEETTGPRRAELEEALNEFEEIINKGNRIDIEHYRKKLEELFDDIENNSFTGLYS